MMHLDNSSALNSIEELSRLGYYEIEIPTNRLVISDQLRILLELPADNLYNINDLYLLIHPDDKDRIISCFTDSLNRGEKLDCEFRFLLPNERIIFVSNKSKIIRDENYSAFGIFGTIQDTTHAKLNEKRLKELIQIDKRKNEILGTVAHDLKSPLSSIAGMSELLKESAGQEQLNIIQYIQEALKTANDIISGLIEIAQLEEGKELLTYEMKDVNTLINESVSHFELRAKKKDLTIETKLCMNAVAEIDTVKFSRIIDNLILNAIKFTDKGGRIVVMTEIKSENIIITVEDNGIGIDSDILPELFNKFSKARRKGTSGESSTGLGLSIVKELVGMHNGSISVVSNINSGSKFIIELPIYRKKFS